MVKFENECVGCPPEMGCLGSCCPYAEVRRLYCDKCKQEVPKLYVVDGDQFCKECATDKLFEDYVDEVISNE